VPVPNVTGKVLGQVLKYCHYHVDKAPPKAGEGASTESTKTDEEVKAWDAEFMQVDQGALFFLIRVPPPPPPPLAPLLPLCL
jgi:S-phase kinase-associated protein 1